MKILCNLVEHRNLKIINSNLLKHGILFILIVNIAL